MVRRVVLTALGVLLLIAGAAAACGSLWILTVLGSDGVLRYGAGTIDPGAQARAAIVDVDRFRVSVPVVGSFGETTLSVATTGGTGVAPDIFFGAGITSDVDAFLTGVPYAVAMRTSGAWTVTDVPGGQTPQDPREQSFWLAADTGARASIPVPPERPLTLLVMEPGGAASGPLEVAVDVTVASAATYALWLGVGASVAILLGLVLLVLGLRRAVRGRHAAPRSRGKHAAGRLVPAIVATQEAGADD